MKIGKNMGKLGKTGENRGKHMKTGENMVKQEKNRAKQTITCLESNIYSGHIMESYMRY